MLPRLLTSARQYIALPTRFISLRTMSTTTSIPRTYSGAIEALNSLQSNAATINAIRASGNKQDSVQNDHSIEYLRRIGYEPTELNALNVLHITGTKGKGSTSAFCSSLLRSLAPGAKVGLYTSPHMVAVRERIRINGVPIEEPLFAKYFWEVWDRLEGADKVNFAELPEKPAYFRFLTILAFHVFLKEKVDATILEVGVGGTYDSTNIVPSPVVTGVTALGIDHVFVLGKTIPEIATQKGGIYKPGVPALAISPQPNTGLDVLATRAKELNASSFTPVPTNPALAAFPLGLAGQHQVQNASLALALIRTFLASNRLPPAFERAKLAGFAEGQEELVAPKAVSGEERDGLERTRWPGRCQVVEDGKVEGGVAGVKWFLDGAHTVESVECCGEWYRGAAKLDQPSGQAPLRALVFNCTAGRSGLSLLGTLLSALGTQPFSHVIFTSNTSYKDGHSKGDLVSAAVDPTSLEIQQEIAEGWEELIQQRQPELKAKVHILGSVQEAVETVRELKSASEEVEVLVTGSLLLIGGLMEVASFPMEV